VSQSNLYGINLVKVIRQIFHKVKVSNGARFEAALPNTRSWSMAMIAIHSRPTAKLPSKSDYLAAVTCELEQCAEVV
jgi:hypothetical protein